ncbi:hypothetical protein Cni_G08319 [Canna indica]|uniref:Uncharacterized protein n=1 Tax=Canna indica TaxID=4628 RepID=A0AAQ3Q8A5_9LILI|nr:hypothetical protein Cni_G08319 [Canna indica]
MGCCASCNAATVVATEGTTKVVLANGKLREYDQPVTPAFVLSEDDAACFFVCDADEMECEGFVSAVDANRELRLGQLYFVLPRSILSHPLQTRDLAALAVKASAALVGTASRRRRGAVAPLVFPVEEAAARKKLTEEKGRQRQPKPRRGRKGSKFTPELVAIPE